MGLVAECNEFYERALGQDFIDCSLKVFNCVHGVVLATVRDYQINVNLFIPCTLSASDALYAWMTARLTADFYDYAVDMRPILRFVQFPPPHTWQRRMLPSPRRLQDLTYDAQRRVVAFEG